MAKLALVNIGMHGHVNPTLGLARELVQGGHELRFFGTEEFAAAIRQTGASFVAYPSVAGKRTAETAALQAAATERGEAPPPEASALARFIEEFTLTLPALKGELERFAPDLVIYDFVALAAKIVADQLGIPTVKFFTTYASNEHYDLLRESFAKYDFPTQERMRAIQTGIDRVLASVGYGSVDLLAAVMAVDSANLVFMPRGFQPMGETFDQRFHFVGPCFQEASPEAALPLLPPGDGPVMVISLGSLFHEWPEFFRGCIEAFGNTAWRVVMSIGSRLDPELLGAIPSNFTVRPHIPQVSLMHFAELFITHGGMNSTMESLAHGVPMIVIPQIEEQALTARRVAEMKLGRCLRRSEVDAAALARAVLEVRADPRIKANALAFQREIAACGGPSAAAAFALKHCGLAPRGVLPDAPRDAHAVSAARES